MQWLLGGGEVIAGVGLFVGLVILYRLLRPPKGMIQERAIVSFPLAWILVGLPFTIAIATSVALIAIGMTTLN
jgi:hypothetical protein